MEHSSTYIYAPPSPRHTPRMESALEFWGCQNSDQVRNVTGLGKKQRTGSQFEVARQKTQDELDTDPKLGSSDQPAVRDEHVDETR